jgi:uncharacterized membrane protein
LIRTGQVLQILVGAVLAVGMGICSVFLPLVAVALFFTICVGVSYLYLGSIPLVILALCSTASLPAMIQVGPASGLAMLTILYAAVILLLWLAGKPASTPIPLLGMPYVVFLVWGTTSTVANSRFDIDAIQNLLVMTIPVLLIAFMCSGSRLARISPGMLHRAWSVSSITAILTFFLIGFSPASRLVDETGARSFALFAMLCVAWHAASWKYEVVGSKWITVALLAGVGISLSRTALMVAIVLVVLSRFNPTRLRDWATTVAWFLAGSVGVYWAVSRIEPLRERFFEGDTSLQLGGLSINAMGRTWMWETTLESYQTSIWVGQGSGSIQELLSSLTTGISHPHNDYLRILHDFGAIGFALWIAAILSFAFHSVRSWITADNSDSASVHLATILAIIGLSLSMLTDNPIVYVFCMVPFGIAIGSSMAITQPVTSTFSRSAESDSAPKAGSIAGAVH